jgi:thymidylate synthase ThyX
LKTVFPYVEENFTESEQAILRPYFTNVDQPVFALVNLPEVVKGALFARYSRSPKSLRRLFLDEFVGDLDLSGDLTFDATIGLRRAEELYEKVFFEYGDDSVAQLGGVHLACEQASNILTKVLEWGRLMSYLEQSTRYLGYDARLPSGHYRYYRPPEILDSSLGARYVGDMDRLFDSYGAMLPKAQAWLQQRYPQEPGDSDFVYRQAIRAKALDAVRGLLPAAAMSNVGIYGTGQSYEMLLLRMRSHPLPEVRTYSIMMLEELRKVIPSFLRRVDIAERGGEWSDYFASTADETKRVLERLWPDALAPNPDEGAAEVQLTDFDPEGEDKVLAAICFPNTTLSDAETMRRVQALGHDEKVALMKAYVGDRRNRRHRPGRAFERTDYRFELVTDYGAFRDLQRHRLLTVEWQALGIDLGYDVPAIIEESGLGEEFDDNIVRSKDLYYAIQEQFPEQAGYAVSLAYRIRYVMQMNAREAIHLLELRSGPQGHPSYRRVAQEMHHAIRDVAGHRAIAATMVHVDHGASDLERLEAERRAEQRRLRVVPGS